MTLLTEEDERNLRQEYELLNRNIWERAHNTWLVHSIIISGSLLLVLASFQYRENLQRGLFLLPTIPIGSLFPFLALTLLIFSFYLQYSTMKVNDIMFERMREIERKLGMSGPKQMYEERIKTKAWYRVRRYSWYFLFVWLIAGYLWALVTWIWP